MSKQLMFYESVVPVSMSRHADASIEPGTGYGFASHATAVPLMAVEFPLAAAEYTIVFSKSGDEVLPAAVLGLRNEQNLYVDGDDKWQAKYVPAFVRRYPFVFSATSADRQTLALCIDESGAGFNREGRGHRLFGDDGKPSDYTQRVLTFLKTFQAHFQRTQQFGQRLHELDLLEPMGLQLKLKDGQTLRAGGFHVIDRKRLRALPADKAAELLKSDELELLYLHLYSLRHFADMKDRLAGGLANDDATALDDTAAPPAQTAH